MDRPFFIVCLNFINDLCIRERRLAGVHWAGGELIGELNPLSSAPLMLSLVSGKEGLHAARPALFFGALRASQFHAKIMVIPVTSGGWPRVH